MLKAVIFDMDGVLINSPDYNRQSFNLILRDYGLNFSKQDWKKTLGRSIQDKLQIWKNDYGLKEDPDFHDLSQSAFKIQKKLMKEKEKPNLSLLNLLRELKKNNIKIGVATSSTKQRAHIILEMINVISFIEVLITAEDVEKHKPHPDLFLKCAEKLQVKPENCVVFEDAKNGVPASKNAGMKTIALLTEFNEKKDFENLSDLIIKDFSEINLKRLKELVS